MHCKFADLGTCTNSRHSDQWGATAKKTWTDQHKTKCDLQTIISLLICTWCRSSRCQKKSGPLRPTRPASLMWTPPCGVSYCSHTQPFFGTYGLVSHEVRPAESYVLHLWSDSRRTALTDHALTNALTSTSYIRCIAYQTKWLLFTTSIHPQHQKYGIKRSKQKRSDLHVYPG